MDQGRQNVLLKGANHQGQSLNQVLNQKGVILTIRKRREFVMVRLGIQNRTGEDSKKGRREKKS